MDLRSDIASGWFGRAVGAAAVVALAACGTEPGTEAGAMQEGEEAASSSSSEPFSLTSGAFVEGAPIPERFTGDGDDVSPPLQWSGAPDGTRSFALAVVDPDVPWGQEVPEFGEMPPPGTQPADLFIHWIVADIPSTTTSLPAGASGGNLPSAARELRTSFALFGAPANQYGGPAPPPGTKAHAYRFVLYALDVESLEGLTDESDYAAFTEAMAGHVLATATLTGYYGR